MANASITIDVKKTLKDLTKIQQRQIPFAASQAMNDAALKATHDLKAETPRYLDRPTPFTLRGFRYRRSSKRNLVTTVYVAPKQARYLHYQVEGGTRYDPGGMAVPINIRLNRYGNIPGRKSGIIRNNRQFIATVKGVYGIWERNKRNQLKLLARIYKRVDYEKRLPFHRIVRHSFEKHFAPAFERRLAAALKTARE